jgi:hypothetical protein
MFTIIIHLESNKTHDTFGAQRMTVKIAVLWVVMLYSTVESYHCEESCCLHLQVSFHEDRERVSSEL